MENILTRYQTSQPGNKLLLCFCGDSLVETAGITGKEEDCLRSAVKEKCDDHTTNYSNKQERSPITKAKQKHIKLIAFSLLPVGWVIKCRTKERSFDESLQKREEDAKRNLF